MNEEYMDSQDIIKEIADLKIRLVFQQQFEREVASVMEPETIADVEEAWNVARLEKDIKQFLSKSRRKRVRMHKLYTLPKWGRALATVFVLLIVSMGAALATTKVIQNGWLNVDIQECKEATTYQVQLATESNNIPKGWEGVFFPSYIPEGYEILNCNEDIVDYEDANGNLLTFSELRHGATLDLNTEKAELSSDVVNGVEATVIEKGKWVAVVWIAHNRLFFVDIEATREEALRIANSVEVIP